MARALLIQEVLENSCISHSKTGKQETNVNTLDWVEINVVLAEGWVDEVVENGNEDDDRDWVQVLNQIIGSAVQLHCGGHRSEITVNLRVAEPEDWEPQENLAGVESSSNLSNEFIIPGDVLGLFASGIGRWLGNFPEPFCLEVLPCSDRVGGPTTASGDFENAKSLQRGKTNAKYQPKGY